MQALVRAAMRDGAMGFTSSQLELHVAHDGRGVPSNYADHDELVALAGVLAEFGRGSIEFIPRSFLVGYDDEDRALIRAMARASGRPVHLNTLTSMPHAPDGWSRSLEFAETAAEDGLAIHPMFATNRQGVHFSLGSTFLFDEMPTFRETLTLPSPAREERLRDPIVRDRMRTELADPAGRSFVFAWSVLRVERVLHPANERWLDQSISDDRSSHERRPSRCLPRPVPRRGPRDPVRRRQSALAGTPGRDRAHDPIACRHGRVLGRRRAPPVVLRCRLHHPPAHRVGPVRADPRTGGCATDARYRREPLESSIGERSLPDMAADVLVIDRESLGAGSARYVRDFPANSGRFVVDATGYQRGHRQWRAPARGGNLDRRNSGAGR